MPDRETIRRLANSLEEKIEATARAMEFCCDGDVIDDWIVVASMTSLDSLDRQVTPYVLITKGGGDLPAHRVSGLADVIHDRCWSDDGPEGWQ